MLLGRKIGHLCRVLVLVLCFTAGSCKLQLACCAECAWAQSIYAILHHQLELHCAGSEPDWVGDAAMNGYHAANYIAYSVHRPGEPSIYVGYNPYSYPLQIDIPDAPNGSQLLLHLSLRCQLMLQLSW